MEYGGRSNSEHKLVWVGIVGIIGLLLVFVAYTFWPNTNAIPVTIGPKTFYAEVADTDEAREIGLTQYAVMKEDQALLMAYNTNAVHMVATKDMQFPIDIMWLDDSKRVAFVARNAAPSDTALYKPSGKARYVMLLPAGAASKYGITVGRQVNFAYESEV